MGTAGWIFIRMKWFCSGWLLVCTERGAGSRPFGYAPRRDSYSQHNLGKYEKCQVGQGEGVDREGQAYYPRKTNEIPYVFSAV